MKSRYWILIIVLATLAHGAAIREIQSRSFTIIMNHFDTGGQYTLGEKLIVSLSSVLFFPLGTLFLMFPLGRLVSGPLGNFLYYLNSLIWGLGTAFVVSLFVPGGSGGDEENVLF